MRGHLAGSTAVDACRDLAEQGATGLLSVDGPDGVGTIMFVDGGIVAATSPSPRSRLGDRLVGSGHLDEDGLREALEIQRASGAGTRLGAVLVEQGRVSVEAIRLVVLEQVLDALFDVLRWRYGSFEFVPGEAVRAEEVPLEVRVDEALVEVARRQQEWEELSQVIPNLEAVPAFRPGASSAAAALEPDEFAVLASVDGERSVRTLAADLGYGEFEAARIVYGLCLLGIVEVRAPEDAVGAALDDALSYVEAHPTRDHEPVVEVADVEVAELDDLFARLGDEPEAAEAGAAGTPPAAEDGAEDEPDLFVAHIDDAPDTPEPRGRASTPPPPPREAPLGARDETARDGRDEPPPAREDASRPGAAADADVSEFLRELSRLALGSDDAPADTSRGETRAPGQRAPDPPRRGEPDDRGRRKRGLFGRGG